MTQSRRGNDIPRSSRPSAHVGPDLGLPSRGGRSSPASRGVPEAGWSSALGRSSRDGGGESDRDRSRRRRAPSHLFHPTIDGRLEGRMLLSAAGKRFVTESALLRHPGARKAYNVKNPPFLVGRRTSFQ